MLTADDARNRLAGKRLAAGVFFGCGRARSRMFASLADSREYAASCLIFTFYWAATTGGHVVYESRLELSLIRTLL
jgi:hypothetical protein